MEQTAQTVLGNLGEYSYLAILSAMLLTGVGLPLPSELTLGFAGFLVYTSKLELIPAIAAAAVGDLLGAILSYGIGFFARTKIVGQYFRFLIPSESKLETITQWLKRYGVFALIFGRILPVIRGVIPISAGFVHMNVTSYMLGNFISSGIWCSALIYLGVELGHNWHLMSGLAKDVGLAVAGIFAVILVVWYLARKE
jgi:membrane protein DedA with SNARE-associated domain